MRSSLGVYRLLGWALAWLGLLTCGFTCGPAWLGAQALADGQQSAARATPAAPAIVDLCVGVRGVYKAGLWTEAAVTVRAGSQPLSARLRLTVPDGDGLPSRFATPPEHIIQLAAGHEQRVSLLIRTGRVQPTVVAELESGGQVVARRLFRAGQSEYFAAAVVGRPVIVVVGPEDPGIHQAALVLGLPADSRPAVALLDSAELVGHLPTHHWGYEGISALVVTTSVPELVRRLAGDAARIEALRQWITVGGKLVFVAGAGAELALADDSPLRQLVPGRIEGLVSLQRTASLETFCRSAIGIRQPQETGPAVQASRLAQPEGNIVLREDDLPLIVHRAWGLGHVLYIAVDLNRPPMSTWGDRGRFVAQLLEFPVLPEQLGPAAVGPKLGYDDIAGQLRSALDRYQGVTVAPFSLLAVMLLVYVLLIGPADYFLLRRFARRMEWTWLSFSLLVAVFCAFGWGLSGRLKGDRLRTHQAELIDWDAQSGLVRGTAWVNVFTPRGRTFDFSFQPRLPDGGLARDAEMFIAWLGLPGGALGGMQGAQFGEVGTLASTPYEFAPQLDAMTGVPIAVASSKSLTARWIARADACVAAQLREEGQVVTGTIRNSLAIPLHRCLLAVGRWAYELGDLESGQTVTVGLETPRTELKTLLTGRRVALYEGGQKFFQHAMRYDPASTDVQYILRMMSFFEDSGGQQYTRLKNQYQSSVDVGHLLKAGRAVLLGFAADGASPVGGQLLDAGRPVAQADDQRTVLLRFVFPVEN